MKKDRLICIHCGKDCGCSIPNKSGGYDVTTICKKCIENLCREFEAPKKTTMTNIFSTSVFCIFFLVYNFIHLLSI